jgi:hypothetical protein
MEWSMRMTITYSVNADRKVITNGEKQNYFIVCDPETGIVYKGTDMKVDASAVSSPSILLVSGQAGLKPQNEDNYIGCVDSAKMIFFENKFGPTDDLMRQIDFASLTVGERKRVLNAKTAYDAGTIPVTGIKTLPSLDNG